jgi:hypothetical protein
MKLLKAVLARMAPPPYRMPGMDPVQLCAGLSMELTRLEMLNGSIRSQRKSPLEAAVVWAEWVASGYQLSKLTRTEFRTLCQEPSTAMNPVFISALVKDPSGLARFPSLAAFVQSYFSSWRTMVRPEQVENIIQALLIHMEPRSKVFQKWRQLPELISGTADQALARQIVNHRGGIDLLEDYNIGLTTNLAAATQTKTIELAIHEFNRMDRERTEDTAVAVVRWIREDLLRVPLSSGLFYNSVGALIMSASAARFPKLQQDLAASLLKDSRLGDPRRSDNSPKWAQVPEEARTRFLGWLARDAIEFFFTAACSDERRKKFWLRYYNRVQNFRCALSGRDELRMRRSMVDLTSVPSYAQIVDQDASAILMQFRGYGGVDLIVVEGGESGYAAQVYVLSDFIRSGASLQKSTLSWKQHLRLSHLTKHRILHVAEWEPKAERALTLLGVFP